MVNENLELTHFTCKPNIILTIQFVSHTYRKEYPIISRQLLSQYNYPLQ